MITQGHTKTGIIVFSLVALLSGAIDRLTYDTSVYVPIAFACSFVGLAVIFWWYIQDSNQHQYRRSVILNVGVIFIGFIVLPYYLFKTRSKKNAIIGILLLFAVVLIVWSVAFEIGHISVSFL